MLKNKYLPTVLAVSLILIGWQLLALWFGYSEIFPTVDKLFVSTLKLLGKESFYTALLFTVLRGGVGFVIAASVAFFCGSLAAFSSFWNRFFTPFVVIIRSVPVISIVLVALLWFSPGNLPVFIAFLTMFPVIYQSVVSSLLSVDRRLVEMAESFGYTRWQKTLAIYLPQVKMIILGGFSTATGFGWRAVIIGEALSQPLYGIGSGMKMAQVYVNVSELFAWTLMAVLVSYLFEILIRRMGKIRFSRRVHLSNNHSGSTSESVRIKLTGVSKNFADQSIIKAFDYSFDAGKVYLLKQTSGKGKTTLLRLIAGLVQPDGGKVSCDKTFRVAICFQDLRLCSWLTVEENVGFAVTTNADRLAIDTLLEVFELTSEKTKFPTQLSGGQQQRVALARALAANAQVLLLDEPLTGLDVALKSKVVRYINTYIVDKKPLVIWATHEEFELSGIEVVETKF